MRACLLILSFSVFTSVGIAASNICVDKTARALLTDTNNHVPLPKLLEKSRGSRLILIGELHFGHPGLRARIIAEIARELGRGACLLYELDHNLTIEEKLREFRQPGFEANFAQFNEMHTAATRAGLREVNVDTAFSWERLDDETVDSRNAFMTSKIAKAFTKCARAVMFVGKAHAVEDEPGQRTLQNRVRALGISTLAINLQDTREGPELTDGLASWNKVCPRGALLPAVNAPVAVALGQLPTTFRLHPRTKNPARWRDFDWALLIP